MVAVIKNISVYYLLFNIWNYNKTKRPGPRFEPESREPQSLRITTTLPRQMAYLF
jgi:hypothetical protein